MSIAITNPDPAGSPPTGEVDSFGALKNAAGNWIRPGGATVGEVARVKAQIFAPTAVAPARPTTLTAQNCPSVSNASGQQGNWFFSGIMGASLNQNNKLVVWLDIEDQACYYRTEVVFLGVAEDAVPPPSPPPMHPGPGKPAKGKREQKSGAKRAKKSAGQAKGQAAST
jgi:hypothetical protein